MGRSTWLSQLMPFVFFSQNRGKYSKTSLVVNRVNLTALHSGITTSMSRVHPFYETPFFAFLRYRKMCGKSGKLSNKSEKSVLFFLLIFKRVVEWGFQRLLFFLIEATYFKTRRHSPLSTEKEEKIGEETDQKADFPF